MSADDNKDDNLMDWFMWLIVILLCVVLPLYFVTRPAEYGGGPDSGQCSNATPSGC